jgi:hypothetical protein
VVGTCKLCLRPNQELKESHLMPAGMYRRTRSEDDENPHPVLITTHGSHQSSKQVTDYVLCGECESRFDKNGENYALRMVKTRDRFRLLEQLKSINPSFEKLDWRGYKMSDTPEIDRDKLGYFALSVYWRASVHTWPPATDYGKPIRIDLGKENNEKLRKYLLGEGEIPSTLSIFFVVCIDVLSQGSFYLPTLSHKKQFTWHYGFAACGFFFNLVVAKRLLPNNTYVCFLKSPERWIWLRNCEAKAVEGFSELIAKQPPDLRLRGQSY